MSAEADLRTLPTQENRMPHACGNSILSPVEGSLENHPEMWRQLLLGGAGKLGCTIEEAWQTVAGRLMASLCFVNKDE